MNINEDDSDKISMMVAMEIITYLNNMNKWINIILQLSQFHH